MNHIAIEHHYIEKAIKLPNYLFSYIKRYNDVVNINSELCDIFNTELQDHYSELNKPSEFFETLKNIGKGYVVVGCVYGTALTLDAIRFSSAYKAFCTLL